MATIIRNGPAAYRVNRNLRTSEAAMSRNWLTLFTAEFSVANKIITENHSGLSILKGHREAVIPIMGGDRSIITQLGAVIQSFRKECRGEQSLDFFYAGA